MKLNVAVVGLLGLGLAFGAGCGRKDKSETAVEIQDITPESVFSELDALTSEGKSDQAIERMKAMISDPAYAEMKSELVSCLLAELSRNKSLAMLQNEYLALAAQDDDVARMGFAVVESASSATNTPGVMAWYDKILVAPVSNTMKVYTWQRIVGANQGSIAPLVDRLGEILSLPSERDSYMVVNALARTGLVRGDYVGLEKLEKAVAEQASQRSDLAKLILPIKIKALTKQKKYAEAKKLVLEHAGELGDSGLRSLQVGIVRGLVQSGKLDEARKLVKSVYADGAKYPTTLASVGLYWVQKAIDDKQAGEFVSRVDELSGAGCSVDHFAFVFRDGFYTVMQSGDRDAINKCSAQLEKFTKTEGLHESTLQVLALLMLDGAFYRNDFKAAYEMVERGVPGYDEKWHAEMRDKVGAHLALQEERYADAIELFRKHMERVAAWTDPVINPVNGARMTKEAVLGFNEKRLGDIFTKMGDEAEAKAAYARAKEWYNKAIKAASPGSIEEKIAKDELQQVP